MSQEKSDGMSPTQLVAAWRNNSKFLHDNPDDYSIGVKAGIDAAADGLELEIKRSNYVSGKEVTEAELSIEIRHMNQVCLKSNEMVKYLLSKYRVIEK